VKKFRLDVDELRVESFDASPWKSGAGVHAHEAVSEETCRSMCPEACTFNDCSAEGTCVYSCRSGPCVCIPQP
jgi:hypothetical protein